MLPWWWWRSSRKKRIVQYMCFTNPSFWCSVFTVRCSPFSCLLSFQNRLQLFALNCVKFLFKRSREHIFFHVSLFSIHIHSIVLLLWSWVSLHSLCCFWMNKKSIYFWPKMKTKWAYDAKLEHKKRNPILCVLILSIHW